MSKITFKNGSTIEILESSEHPELKGLPCNIFFCNCKECEPVILAPEEGVTYKGVIDG